MTNNQLGHRKATAAKSVWNKIVHLAQLYLLHSGAVYAIQNTRSNTKLTRYLRSKWNLLSWCLRQHCSSLTDDTQHWALFVFLSSLSSLGENVINLSQVQCKTSIL